MRNEVGGSSNSRGESVVDDCGRCQSSCGYCRSPGLNNISHGLLAQSLTVDDYQDLIDRGWRRSGCVLYKPEMEAMCCPSYTIRLKASEFVPSKDQLRVSRRMQRFSDGSWDVKKVDVSEDPDISKESESSVHHVLSSPTLEESLPFNNEKQNEVAKALHSLSDQIDNVVSMFTEKGEFFSDIQLPKASVRLVSQGKKKLLANGSEDLLYSSNIAFQLAASLRKAQFGERDVHQSNLSRDCAEENRSSPKIIAEELAAALDPEVKNYGLSIRACTGHINFYSPSKQNSLSGSVQNAAVSKKYGMKHDSGDDCLSKPQSRQVQRRRIEIRLKRSSFDPEEFALYRRYQLTVHKDRLDDVTQKSYCRFLVDTPLLYVSPTGDERVPPCGFGSFHQQYLIDGQLVAVGVVDILPKCLSSKYLFWDPDFAFLSLGKYSALQEISWVKENQVYCPSLQYYYLGYYIHSCSKMRYKAAYRPSELLCPLRYQWVQYDIAKPLLDREPYVVLSDYSIQQNGKSSPPQATEDVMERQLDDIGQEDANDFLMDEDEENIDSESESSDNADVSKISLGLDGSRFTYKDLRSSLRPKERNHLESQLKRYMRLVGPELSERMVYLL